jgi:LysR family transcriptional activator of nhaA
MLNYRHLYYFWMVSKEGGFARAAARLDMAVQTISAQVHELEKSLGMQLFKPLGRGVVLTEAGHVALSHAEEIFQREKALVEAVQDAATGRTIRLAVGLSDGISKLAAYAVIRPILDTPDLRLVCHEGELAQLQAELAMHSLDLVLAGRPSPDNPNLRLISDRLISSPVAWYGPAGLLEKDIVDTFPRSLERLPVLLPTGHSALRANLDHWFDAQNLKVKVVGEFEDSALMMVFAAHGLGVFPISRLGADDSGLMPGLIPLGCCEGVNENIYAIRSRHSQHHPLVQRLIA